MKKKKHSNYNIYNAQLSDRQSLLWVRRQIWATNYTETLGVVGRTLRLIMHLSMTTFEAQIMRHWQRASATKIRHKRRGNICMRLSNIAMSQAGPRYLHSSISIHNRTSMWTKNMRINLFFEWKCANVQNVMRRFGTTSRFFIPNRVFIWPIFNCSLKNRLQLRSENDMQNVFFSSRFSILCSIFIWRRQCCLTK